MKLVLATVLSLAIAVKLQVKSNDPKYRELIGRSFAIKSEFKVYGVRMDLRAEAPDFFQMLPAAGPGVAGPEIIDFGRLPAGTPLLFAAAYEEKLGGATVYEVVVLGPAEPRFSNLRIRINNAAAFKLYLGARYPSGAPRLNDQWFTEPAAQ